MRFFAVKKDENIYAKQMSLFTSRDKNSAFSLFPNAAKLNKNRIILGILNAIRLNNKMQNSRMNGKLFSIFLWLRRKLLLLKINRYS